MVTFDELVSTGSTNGDEDWLVEFEDYLLAQVASVRSVSAYVSDVRKFVEWNEAVMGKVVTPDQFTTARAQEWRRVTLGALSPQTWNRRLASLRRLAGWAVKAGYLGYDPTENLKKATDVGEEDEPRWLEPDERLRVLDWFENRVHIAAGRGRGERQRQALRDYAIILLGMKAGLRAGEIVALDVDDLTLKRSRGDVNIRNGKGDKSAIVPLGEAVRDALRRWLEVRESTAHDVGALFTSQAGGRLNRGMPSRLMQECVEGLGLDEGISFHSLRHTCARILVNDLKVALPTAKRILRHASIQTTARYARAGLRDAVEAVEGL